MSELAQNMLSVPSDGRANRTGTTYAFLPCALSTVGRIQGEGGLRLLYLITHRRTLGFLKMTSMSLALRPSLGIRLSVSGNIVLPLGLRLLALLPAAPFETNHIPLGTLVDAGAPDPLFLAAP